MAQTWPVTRRKLMALRIADALGVAGSLIPRLIWRPRRDTGQGIRNILVIEPWLIGDVVLVTPVLQALRARFPDARLSLLGKPHAAELLRNSGLVDDVIEFDLPWTANTHKYRPSRYDRRAIRDLLGLLRRCEFDLTIDCRMDIRSNVVAFATGAPRRIGYDFGGGSYLLTDALTAAPDDHHKVDDWLALLGPLGDSGYRGHVSSTAAGASYKPRLSVTPGERAEAVRRLGALGCMEGDVIVGVHPGASQPRRRWPLEDFAWVIDSLVARDSETVPAPASLESSQVRASTVRVLVFVDPENYGVDMKLQTDARFIRTSLREMMAAFTLCDVVICNDSGPMHIADALQVPVVGIFTTGNPVWHRPYGEHQITVGHGTGHDFVSYPDRAAVLDAAERQLQRSLETRSVRPPA